MPVITHDPSLAQIPDFGGVPFDTIRTSLVNADRDNAAVIISLENAWQTSNTAERAAWDAQMAEEAALIAERKEAERLAADAAHALEQQELTTARLEEEKKTRAKFPAIPANGVPDLFPVIVSPGIRKKLRAGDWVALWNFTDTGLDDLRKDPAGADYDAVNLIKLASGNGLAWEDARNSATSRNIVDDSDLAWDEFTQAAPRLVTAMQEAAWPQDRVDMFATFFGNLHLYSLGVNEGSAQATRRALLLYQSEQRKQWHVTILNPATACSLALLNMALLSRYSQRITTADHDRAEARRDARSVSPSLLLFVRFTNSFLSFSLFLNKLL